MPRRASPHNPANRPSAICAAAVAALLLLVARPAPATVYNGQNPDNPNNQASPWTKDLEAEVGIIEKLNSPVPTGLTFTDADGQAVGLDSFFKPGRPVVINLGYSRCPSICIIMKDQLTSVLPDIGLKLGEDFVILNISLDPNQTPEQSRAERDHVWGQMQARGMEPSPEGWRFLTADQATITELTEALGYRYLYIKPQDEFGHPGVLVLADGEGVIRRYLGGTAYSARTLRLSVVETSDGKAGGLLDKVFVTCFAWDPEANNYAATAKFIMMIAGGVTMVALAGLVFAGFAYEKRRRKLAEQPAPQPDAVPAH